MANNQLKKSINVFWILLDWLGFGGVRKGLEDESLTTSPLPRLCYMLWHFHLLNYTTFLSAAIQWEKMKPSPCCEFHYNERARADWHTQKNQPQRTKRNKLIYWCDNGGGGWSADSWDVGSVRYKLYFYLSIRENEVIVMSWFPLERVEQEQTDITTKNHKLGETEKKTTNWW